MIPQRIARTWGATTRAHVTNAAHFDAVRASFRAVAVRTASPVAFRLPVTMSKEVTHACAVAGGGRGSGSVASRVWHSVKAASNDDQQVNLSNYEPFFM